MQFKDLAIGARFRFQGEFSTGHPYVKLTVGKYRDDPQQFQHPPHDDKPVVHQVGTTKVEVSILTLGRVYSAEYVGGEYGSPNDYGVRFTWAGNATIDVPPIDHIVLLVDTREAAEKIAALLNNHGAFAPVIP